MMLADEEAGLSLYCERLDYSPDRVKSLFLLLDKSMNRLGVVPTRLGAHRQGVQGSGLYRTYRRLRPRLVRLDFADVRSVTLESLPANRAKDYKSWKAHAAISSTRRVGFIRDHNSVWQQNWAPRDENRVCWQLTYTVFPYDANVDSRAALSELLAVSKPAMDDYGYLLWIRRGAHPSVFMMDMGFGGEHKFRTRDEIWNRYTWTRFGTWTKRLLRDTYPYNFLGRAYLDLPIEGTTLEKWILADEARGTLEPFNDRVWLWKPVIDQIPYIREPLFRAGILHWWGMFCVDDWTQLQVKEPFKPPAETPLMFRPEYYAGRDPKITN